MSIHKHISNISKLFANTEKEFLTKKDFLDAFSDVVEIVLEVKKENSQILAALGNAHNLSSNKLKSDHATSVANLKSDHESSLKEIKGKFDSMFSHEKSEHTNRISLSAKQMKDIGALIDKKLADVDVKLGSVKNGEDGHTPTTSEIEIALTGSMDAFRKAWDEKVDIAMKRGRGGGGPSANSVQVEDLSSTVNGTLRTFTVPRHRKPLLVISTQAPFILRPTADFTTANTRLNINENLDRFAEGQTLVFLYLK